MKGTLALLTLFVGHAFFIGSSCGQKTKQTTTTRNPYTSTPTTTPRTHATTRVPPATRPGTPTTKTTYPRTPVPGTKVPVPKVPGKAGEGEGATVVTVLSPDSPLKKLPWGKFKVEVPESTVKILACPTGAGIKIITAHWIATVKGPAASPTQKFYRGQELAKICTGLNHCLLHPYARLDQVKNDFYQFFGNPFEDATYVLEVEGSCEPNPTIMQGRRAIASIDPKEDLVMGCNEGEVISLSYVRGACIVSNAFYRELYRCHSFYETVYQDCAGKRTCTIKHERYPKDKLCSYKAVDVLYSCHKRPYHAFADRIMENNEEIIVLTAEEDSRITVKAPAEKVLTVKTATWDVIGKAVKVDDPMRNRLDLLQFYCEGRSSCLYYPKRTSDGFRELHMGGITGDVTKRFYLRAKFGLLQNNKELQKHQILTTTVKKGSRINVSCEAGKSLRVVTARWGGELTETPDPKEKTVFWEEVEVNGKKHRVAEVGAYLDWMVTGKRTLNFDIFERNEALNKVRPPIPFIPGVKEENHEVTVRYICMDATEAPSIADAKLSDLYTLTDGVDKKYGQLEKEQIKEFKFKNNAQLIIAIQQKADTDVKVGEYVTFHLPYTTKKYTVGLVDGMKHEHTMDETGFGDVVLSIIIADGWRLHFEAAFYKDGKPVKTYTDELLFNQLNKYEKASKDIVVATGGATGMRVLYQEAVDETELLH